MSETERSFSESEINQRLAEALPQWRYENGWIRRKYKTNSWKGTLMVVNTVGHLAEVAWHHPDLVVSYAFVEVKLMTHSAKGITEKDFALAKKMDDVVMWQPSEEDGPFEGTPSDQRFKYVKYDK
jgi:4a-hydroxytetrahydrobiopterin dehydratase